MALIRGKDTKPEMAVRRVLHRAGYRFRVHNTRLPGRPDIVFTGRKKVVMVHGCFWHQHDSNICRHGRRPKSNTGYWDSKLARNANRDRRNEAELRSAGWDVLTVWACEVEKPFALSLKIQDFLGPPKSRPNSNAGGD